MTFVRLKSKRNSLGERLEYAYLVENRWLKQRQQPVQRVKKYLGRAYRPVKKEVGFLDFLQDDKDVLAEGSFHEIVKRLVEWELCQHGAGWILVDWEGRRVTDKQERPAVLVMNQGFLCDHTLGQLLSVRLSEDEPEGYSLAKALVEAGIEVPKEVFVCLYERMPGNK